MIHVPNLWISRARRDVSVTFATLGGGGNNDEGCPTCDFLRGTCSGLRFLRSRLKGRNASELWPPAILREFPNASHPATLTLDLFRICSSSSQWETGHVK
jgi:hypothetical protein